MFCNINIICFVSSLVIRISPLFIYMRTCLFNVCRVAGEGGGGSCGVFSVHLNTWYGTWRVGPVEGG